MKGRDFVEVFGSSVEISALCVVSPVWRLSEALIACMESAIVVECSDRNVVTSSSEERRRSYSLLALLWSIMIARMISAMKTLRTAVQSRMASLRDQRCRPISSNSACARPSAVEARPRAPEPVLSAMTCVTCRDLR